MKVMIVSGQNSLRMSMSKTLNMLMGDVQFISTDHENALVMFLDEDPKTVLICEYEEKGSGEEDWNKGRATFKDISGSADETARVIRLGFSDYVYDNYIKMPFEISEVIQKIRVLEL